MRRRSVVPALLCAFTLLASNAGRAHPESPTGGGHLPPVARNTKLVSKLQLTQRANGISDVAVLGNYAYVGAFAGECPTGGGVHVVDISVPVAPMPAAFIPAGTNTYVGEGVQALHLETPSFTGDILIHSNQPCGRSGGRGGFSIWDVTIPRAPRQLASQVGEKTKGRTHPAHSVFAWQAGSKAYAVMQDESGDPLDVDLFDITDPRAPKFIKETGLPHWPKARDAQARGMGTTPASFFHDVWVRRIGNAWLMLLSYWDAGWIVLNVNDPRKPVYVKNSTYPARDRLTKRAPEGNAHQGVWSNDGRYIIGTNEDMFNKITIVAAERGFSIAAEIPWARKIRSTYKDATLEGPTIYGGNGCSGASKLPKRSSLRTGSGEQAIVILLEGGCTRGQKIRAAQDAGYHAAIIAAAHERAENGRHPNRFDCLPHSDGTAARINGLCVGHSAFHTLLNLTPSYAAANEPAVGRKGQRITVVTFEDGNWGDMRLLDASTMREIDAHQVAEGLSPGYAEAAGNLSVHEVKVDPRPGVNLAYASWYGAGLRVLKFGSAGLTETGAFIDASGNEFWGTFPLNRPSPLTPIVALSDMHHGLYLVEYTGPS